MEKVIESKIPGYGYKVLTAPGEKIYFKCDPKLNKECDHKNCSYEHTGPCEFTSKNECALLIPLKKGKTHEKK